MGFICPGRRELDAASAMGVRVAAAGSAAASTEGRPFAGEPGTDSRAARLWREPRAWAPHPGPVSPPLPRPPRSSSSSSSASSSAVAVVDAAPVATRLRSFTSAQELLAVQRTVAALAESGFYWGSVAGPEARRLLASQSVGTFLVRDSTDPRHLFSLTLRTRLGATSVRVQLHAGRFRLECSQRRDALPGFDCVLRLLEHYVRPAGPPGADFNNGDNNNNDNAAAQSGGGGRGGGAPHRHAQRGGPLAVTERGSVAEKRRAQQQQREQQQQQRQQEEEAEARAAAGVSGKGRTPLLLTRPLRHTRVPQLQHLARKAVHRALAGRKPEQLQLPSLLQGYLETYPYQL
ncbi:suppressor of cytokine signaling 3-like [Lampetra fluviatilis]